MPHGNVARNRPGSSVSVRRCRELRCHGNVKSRKLYPTKTAMRYTIKALRVTGLKNTTIWLRNLETVHLQTWKRTLTGALFIMSRQQNPVFNSRPWFISEAWKENVIKKHAGYDNFSLQPLKSLKLVNLILSKRHYLGLSVRT